MTYEIHKFAKYVSAFLYYAQWFFFLCGVSQRKWYTIWLDGTKISKQRSICFSNLVFEWCWFHNWLYYKQCGSNDNDIDYNSTLH